MTEFQTRAAAEWLLSAAPDPAECRRQWGRGPQGMVLLPAGVKWDVLILPGALGHPTLDVLSRCAGRPGPVLSGAGGVRLGFFVPPGTASRWLGTGVRAVGRGTWIVVPHPGRAAGVVSWLVRPDGSGALNDPGLLELAMHEAVAGEGWGRSGGW
ncbi:bifunctional DNA primase/polymerase [Streptomyces albidoflavus]|uniref:bifunctional DNA primase/polymerase n=1 Tax=Streptomyces albidoflavus TaxID=1886 RepID=UPI0034455D5E